MVRAYQVRECKCDGLVCKFEANQLRESQLVGCKTEKGHGKLNFKTSGGNEKVALLRGIYQWN